MISKWLQKLRGGGSSNEPREPATMPEAPSMPSEPPAQPGMPEEGMPESGDEPA